jgi:hypothetical protein
MLADALATLGLQPQNAGQQVVGALVPPPGVLRVDAGVGLPHHRRDMLLVIQRLHGDLAKIGAQRGAAAAVGDRPAGDDDAHRAAAGDEILHRLADLGALAFVRHFVESVEQQQDVAALPEQADEEVDRQIEGCFATDQVVRDEVRQRLFVCRRSGRQLAPVARKRGQRHEDRQRQLARRHRQAKARARRFGLAGEQRRRQRPGHVQQHRRLAAARPADDRQTIAQPEDLVQGDVGFAAGGFAGKVRGALVVGRAAASGRTPRSESLVRFAGTRQ